MEIESVHEDIGYRIHTHRGPGKSSITRDLVDHINRVCAGKDQHEQFCIEREGLEELHRKYPTAGFDKILRDEARFHP